MTLTVTDDGRGPGTVTGMGLIGIRERASAHGGTARTGAGPGGRGFRVRVTIPLSAMQMDANGKAHTGVES